MGKWIACLLLLATGCASKRPLAVAAPSREYRDLQVGQTLRVITPVLRGGGTQLAEGAVSAGERAGQLAITVDTKGEFLGYEEAHYRVEPGLDIRCSRVETVVDGVRTPQAEPRAQLFRLPRRARHVRLLYLLRSSEQEHNMAILAAPDVARLDRLTGMVRVDPAGSCRAPWCSWVPAGVAVRVEE